jgi:hypothetical protein
VVSVHGCIVLINLGNCSAPSGHAYIRCSALTKFGCVGKAGMYLGRRSLPCARGRTATRPPNSEISSSPAKLESISEPVRQLGVIRRMIFVSYPSAWGLAIRRQSILLSGSISVPPTVHGQSDQLGCLSALAEVRGVIYTHGKCEPSSKGRIRSPA